MQMKSLYINKSFKEKNNSKNKLNFNNIKMGMNPMNQMGMNPMN